MKIAWGNVSITAEELAVIVPVPEAVLDDADYDIWGEVRPALSEAFSVAITAAVLYGTNIPASWSVSLGAAGLFARATAAGHVVSAANYADLYEAIMGETNAGAAACSCPEADGFMHTGHIGSAAMRGRLRNVRDINGVPLFVRSMQDTVRYELDGSPIYFPTDGTVIDATSWMFTGDWTQLVYAFRQDITYKLLDQAVIQDGAGNIVYNLAQQDMALRGSCDWLGPAQPDQPNERERRHQASVRRTDRLTGGRCLYPSTPTGAPARR